MVSEGEEGEEELISSPSVIVVASAYVFVILDDALVAEKATRREGKKMKTRVKRNQGEKKSFFPPVFDPVSAARDRDARDIRRIQV